MPMPKVCIVFLFVGLVACSNGGDESGKSEVNIEGQALDAFDCDLYPSRHEGCWLSEPCANDEDVSSRKLLRITDDEFHFYTVNYEVRDCLGAATISTDVLRQYLPPPTSLNPPVTTEEVEPIPDVRPYVSERYELFHKTSLVIGDDDVVYGPYPQLGFGSTPTDYVDESYAELGFGNTPTDYVDEIYVGSGSGVNLTPESEFNLVVQTKTLVDIENNRLCFSDGVYFVTQGPVGLVTEDELLSGFTFGPIAEEIHVFSWIDALNNDINYENCFDRLN